MSATKARPRVDDLDIDRDADEWGRAVTRLAVAAVDRFGPVHEWTVEESRAEFRRLAVAVARGVEGRYDPAKGKFSTYLYRSYLWNLPRHRRTANAKCRRPAGRQVLSLSEGDLAHDEALTDRRAVDQVDAAAAAERRAFVAGLLRRLDRRDRELLTLVYGLDGRPPHTLAEAGAVMGFGKERARQLRERALRRLRATYQGGATSGHAL